MNKRKLGIAIVVITLLLISVSSWFAFDLNSKINVLKHPEKYSYRMNFASFMMQNDYYLYAKYPNNTDTFFKELKTLEKRYENKTDATSIRIQHLNNQALDLYHDLLALNNDIPNISNDDFLFLDKNCPILFGFYFGNLLTYPVLENKKQLFNELKMRQEAIAIVKEDLKDRKIDADVSLDDVKYENLIPAYISYKPNYVKEFEKIFGDGRASIRKSINNDYDEALKNAKNEEEKTLIDIEYAKRYHTEYLHLIDNFNIKWKHRYLITAVEYKHNSDTKIVHLFQIYPYKEGNRIYWNVQYHAPNSEFIKAYLKMLELLINL